MPRRRSTPTSTVAPRAIRAQATVEGVMPSTAPVMNRKDQPQTKDSRNNPRIGGRTAAGPAAGGGLFAREGILVRVGDRLGGQFGRFPCEPSPVALRREPRIGSMPKSSVERRLRQVAGRLRQLRDELEVSSEQLAHLAGTADDARLRALVSETPVSERDHTEAARHADAMRRHRTSVAEEIARLETEQDELLDRLLAETR